MWAPDVSGTYRALYRHQRNLKRPSGGRESSRLASVAYDPEFRLIERRDFLMADARNLLLVDVPEDTERWFYWRPTYWHRHPKVIRKRSYLRKLKRIMHSPERRATERPCVPPCRWCGSPLEWFVRRSHELAFKCSRCKRLYMHGSPGLDGPPGEAS